MLLKIALAAGVVATCGFYYYRMPSVDPNVFPYSKDQLQSMLVGAKTTLPRRDGPGQIQLWSTGRSAKGVALNLQYASWAPLLKCEAVITVVAPDRSRVAADCSGASKNDSAIGRTQDALQAPMFEEHIQATLNKRPFDRKAVDRSQTAVVFSNLGGMQREARQMYESEQR